MDSEREQREARETAEVESWGSYGTFHGLACRCPECLEREEEDLEAAAVASDESFAQPESWVLAFG